MNAIRATVPMKVAGILMEMQAGLHHLRVVEHHEHVFWQMLRNTEEAVFTDDAVPVEQQFGAVALGQRIFGYALVGERIVVVFYLYAFRVCHIVYPINTSRKRAHSHRPDSGRDAR